MARIRTLKPEFWADEKLGPCDPLTRLVFLGLISQADDAGRLVDSVRQLDGLLFPYTDDSCAAPLDTLARLSRIRRYTSESGQRLIQIEGWAEHQKVDKPSKYVLPPPPPESAAVTPFSEVSRDGRDTLAKDSRSDLGPTTPEQVPTTDTATTRPASPSADSVEHEQATTAAPEPPADPPPAETEPPPEPPPIVTRPGAYTLAELADLAFRTMGLGRIGYADRQANHALLNGWLYAGEGKRDPFEIALAIEGAADMRDRDLIGWDSARPGMTITLRALVKAHTLANQGDGKAVRTLYDVAVEHQRKRDTEPRRTPPTRAKTNAMQRLDVSVPA